MKNFAILFIVTSHATMGEKDKPTGVWLEELTTPYFVFKDVECEVQIVSINGGAIPIDPSSQQADNPPSVDRFLKDSDAMAAINNTPSIEEVNANEYAAVFLPGGHGTMWDLPGNKRLAEIVTETLEDKRVMSAVCHGPAGLVSAVGSNGDPVVKGRDVAAFTNSEEDAVGLTDAVPFLLESRLRELGANVITVPDFEAHAVADGNLITGQNPASSEKVAELVVEYLQKH